nr:unnamed protein product [Digitaria exilis]
MTAAAAVAALHSPPPAAAAAAPPSRVLRVGAAGPAPRSSSFSFPREAFGWASRLQRRRGRRRAAAAAQPEKKMARPPILSVALPSDTGRVLSIQSHTVQVVPVASMLTPNQFEVELLTGLRITSEEDGLTACNTLHSAGPQKEQPPEQFKIEIPKIPAYFTGTGDLTTALLLGWSNKYPDNLETAAELAVSSLQEAASCH